jgi:hypothetical protein
MINPRPSQIDSEERLTNYIFPKNWFYLKKQEVKVQAFRARCPKSEPSEFQLSVYRTEECEESEIWFLGDSYVRDMRPDHKPPILARGDIIAKDAIDQDLQVISDPHPHFLHANIVNWPIDEENAEELREMKAVELAKKAVLYIHPAPA